jgi:hypothetical protein
MTTCDSCGVEWVQKSGIDIKDHWYEYIMSDTDSIMFCEQCHADGNARIPLPHGSDEQHELWRINYLAKFNKTT